MNLEEQSGREVVGVVHLLAHRIAEPSPSINNIFRLYSFGLYYIHGVIIVVHGCIRLNEEGEGGRESAEREREGDSDREEKGEKGRNILLQKGVIII